MHSKEPPVVAYWNASGPVSLAVDAVLKNYPDCLAGLLSAKVHVGCGHQASLLDGRTNGYTNENCNLMTWATEMRRWDCLQRMVNLKAELTASERVFNWSLPNDDNRRWHYNTPEFWKVMKVNLGLEALEEVKPDTQLFEALAGTLEVTAEVDPDYGDTTILMMAAAGGHHSLVDKLIKHRATIDKQNSEGLTALAFAADCGFVENTTRCLELLLNAGANVNHQYGKTYKREHHRLRGLNSSVAHAVCRMGDIEKLDLLLKAKMDVNLTNDNGVTPLFEATTSLSKECLRRLVAAKADVGHKAHTARHGGGDTPNYKESMCLCSFADMHAPKEGDIVKIFREILRFEWDHAYMTDSMCRRHLFVDFCTRGKQIVSEHSLSDVEWCLENGMPKTRRYKRGFWFWTNLQGEVLITTMSHNTGTKMLHRMWDLKFSPMEIEFHGNEAKMPGFHFYWCLQHTNYLDWVGRFSEKWNEYQILLAARGEE
jgi:hypothetical protein